MTPATSPIPPFKLERFFAQWEFNVKYLLCSSDVEGYAMRDVLALADDESRELWDDLSLGYTETPGHPLLRREIAALYGALSEDDVLTFAGAEEAVYVTMRALLRPGDHVVVTWPGYQSLYQIAPAIGADVTLLALTQTLSTGEREAGWGIDVEALRAAVRPNTKLIVTNFPHNPTGALPTPDEWRTIITIAREAGCWLFSDEVYRWSEYDPSDRLPAAADCYDKAISLGVMSKSFALAGLRIGWLASPDHDFLDAAKTYKDYTSLCNSAPSEIVALIALRAKQCVIQRSVSMIRRNLALVDRFMAEHADTFEWIRPRAGSVAFPKLLGKQPIEQFALELAQREGVLVLPGSVYDYPGNHFRLGLGRRNAPEALARLDTFVRAR
jgi:aspartate/methionine/tyrosine aminotransferase